MWVKHISDNSWQLPGKLHSLTSMGRGNPGRSDAALSAQTSLLTHIGALCQFCPYGKLVNSKPSLIKVCVNMAKSEMRAAIRCLAYREHVSTLWLYEHVTTVASLYNIVKHNMMWYQVLYDFIFYYLIVSYITIFYPILYWIILGYIKFHDNILCWKIFEHVPLYFLLILYHAMMCFNMLYYVILCFIRAYYDMLCYVRLCYYIILCHVMLYCVVI